MKQHVLPASLAAAPVLRFPRERDLRQMMQEHQMIRTAATEFRKEAQSADRAEYVGFADQLAAHTRQEAEILYPAAVFVGRYVSCTAPR